MRTQLIFCALAVWGTLSFAAAEPGKTFRSPFWQSVELLEKSKTGGDYLNAIKNIVDARTFHFIQEKHPNLKIPIHVTRRDKNSFFLKVGEMGVAISFRFSKDEGLPMAVINGHEIPFLSSDEPSVIFEKIRSILPARSAGTLLLPAAFSIDLSGGGYLIDRALYLTGYLKSYGPTETCGLVNEFDLACNKLPADPIEEIDATLKNDVARTISPNPKIIYDDQQLAKLIDTYGGRRLRYSGVPDSCSAMMGNAKTCVQGRLGHESDRFNINSVARAQFGLPDAGKSPSTLPSGSSAKP